MTFDNSNLPAIFCKTESNKKANNDAGSIQRIFMALFDPGKGLLLPRDINATRTTSTKLVLLRLQRRDKHHD